jgi:hypothetical protein
MLTFGFSLGMGTFPLTGAYLTSNPQNSAKVILGECSWQEHRLSDRDYRRGTLTIV